MNLVYFIRLILKNVGLILGVALAMSIIVYIFAGRQAKTYTSSTVIYTGIATGYDLESGENRRFDFYATSAQFDNLINIIKSREVQEETGIRLMAQHLMLDQPDSKICSSITWRALMDEAPREIKNLVVYESDSTAGNSVKEEVKSPQQTDIDVNSPSDSSITTQDFLQDSVTTTVYEPHTERVQVERFKEVPRYYTVKAGDYPSAIAKRFSISLEKLESLNPGAEFPIRGGQRLNVGSTQESFFVDSMVTTNVPVEKKVDTTHAVSIPKDTISRDYVKRMDSLNTAFSATVAAIIEKIDPYEKTVANFKRYKERDQQNYIYTTLQSSNPIYSVQKISSIKATRIQSSDLLRLTFDSNDPAVCMNTLKIITQVFTQQHQKITAAQTILVADYFRSMVNKAKNQLDSLELILQEFNRQNRIINFTEQARFIAEQKELVDKDWSEAYGKVSAGKAALQVIEENLDEKARLFVENSNILEKRRNLHEITALIATEEIKAEQGPEVMSSLLTAAEKIKQELNDAITAGYFAERTKEGIKIQDVLTAWFQKAIEVEESRARFEVITQRKKDFLERFDGMAPLGGRLRQLERELENVQQDYMAHLHNLNLSIMKQKNVEQANVQVLDEPILPLKSNPSKRLFSVIAAFLAGISLTAAALILMEFLDNSIKFPERFTELTGLNLLGAFVKIPQQPDTQVDFNLITSRLMDQISQKIRLEELNQKSRGDQPFVVFLVSTRDREGKTFLGSRIAEKLRVSGSKVLFIKPHESKNPSDFQTQFQRFGSHSDAWDFEYEVPDNFLTIRNINELLRNFTFLTKGYQFIFIELPALLTHEYPASLVRSGNLSVLTGRASRSWNRADSEILKLYSSTINHPIIALLNGCQVDNLETIIGEIPRRKTLLKKLINKIINLDFKLVRTY